MRQTTAQHRNTVAQPDQAHGVAVGLHSNPHSSFIIHPSSFPQRRAYTLIEVMIVAVIVVLMLGMALPVFRVITGSRSEAGASNLIASMLGRARTDAIGLDKPIGVAVLYNPSSQLSYLAEVGFADAPAWIANQYVNPGAYVSVTSSTGYVYYYVNPTKSQIGPLTAAPTAPTLTSQSNGLYPVCGEPIDTLPNTELLPLPTGIGVQTICNCNYNTSTPPQRISDGYLRFGVVLFDGSGRMISHNYGVSQYSNLISSSKLGTDYPTATQTIYTNGQFGVSSQYGLVVYQQEAFQGQQASVPDALYTDATPASSATALPSYTSTTPSQQTEENWLDQNATPLLINRYTGTLIKAE